MAAPKDSPETGFRLRKFEGTNTEIDSTFLGPSLVSRSENWIPTQSYRLGKRPGTTLVHALSPGVPNVTRVTDLLAVRSQAGALFLYAYGPCSSPASGVVAVSTDEGPFTAGPAGFSSTTAIGRMIQFRDRIYCGNGVDHIKSWVIGGSSVEEYGPMSNTDLTGSSVTTVDIAAGDDTAQAMPTGEYTYAWAVFNPTSGRYNSRTQPSQVATVKVTMGVEPNKSGQILRVQAPSTALTAPNVYRFFIAYRGFPIEYATAQGADWAASEVRTFSSIDVTELRVPYHAGAGLVRTGNMFVVWRNRLVFSGMAGDPYSVFATDVILPGLEQTIYNQGTFFPVNAKVPLPRKVTGIAVAGVTTDQEAHAPLVFFTLTKTFVVMGDPFSTIEQAELIELSSRIGCIAHDSIVPTPFGLIFCGLDSVYLIPPGGGYPQDIGWPIADQIRAIPPTQRERVHAVFHKQFYKLTISAPGGVANGHSWWLDLRQGVGATPSWWGPHTIRQDIAVPTLQGLGPMTTDVESAEEVDRGYAVLEGTDRVVRLHQLNTYTDYISGTGTPATTVQTPVKSVLRTGRFDAEMPFDIKVFTRIRLIAQTALRSAIAVNFKTDGGEDWMIDPIILGLNIPPAGQFMRAAEGAPAPVPPGPPTWKSWNRIVRDAAGNITLRTTGFATFGSIAPVEVQTITPAIRPRGLSAVLSLTHDPAEQPHDPDDPRHGIGNVELRDFELLCLISGRKVRYLGERTGK